MKEFKGTMGPWHRNIPPATKYPTIYAGRNTHVARVVVGGINPEEVDANASLIAAAPEMLEMLQSCLGFIEELKRHGIDNWSEENKLRSLIKKATTI